jgi:hypothetical protein
MCLGMGTPFNISNEQHNHGVLTFIGHMRQNKGIAAFDVAETS